MNNIDSNTQEVLLVARRTICLSVVSLSMALTACGSGSDNSINSRSNGEQGCGITGSRLLAKKMGPYNGFNGSSRSTKVWNGEYYDWYPLGLSVVEDRHKALNTITRSSSPSDDCYEIGSQVLLTNGGNAENNPDLFSNMTLELTFPDYNYDIRPSSSDLDDVVVTSVTPTIKIVNSLHEIVNTTTSIVLSENEYKGTLKCVQTFSVNTRWQEMIHVTTDPDIMYTDDDSNIFSIYHLAKFSADQCEVSFSGEFTLKDGRIMGADILGRLETVEDKDGYTLFIDVLTLGAEK